ncbi:MAG TPA: hypothetical protein VF775_04930 [Geobacteraceae bacterium]
MKLRLLCLAFLLGVTLSACSSSHDTVNPKLTPAAIAAIRKGTTTRDQVRLLLGAPQSTRTQTPITRPPGTMPLPVKYAAAEVWAFWSSRTEGSWFRLPFIGSAAPKRSGRTLIIYFDPQGIVLDCQVEETHT